ncbi:polysaccharide deacetylase [Aneurinibacillus soli]|uniref:Poly-beta-1,6-N-acetyl-D-glucosamine N-deacetylase n=1 Tax=Aneurinibacillus soli TaxID=1500254 RepID=A0A0U5BET6_9BACL|nr:polysaccharide deacetylase family protein [Aneurinibacillus soli]PYE58805.1 polysaccharide deacetylase [Aneurinibacillus soli]BAU26670.1 Poly-beta-1,6-N-acetyl-D-glucosamine N-deacetylase precursor [Aneurinibacillus soli]
MKKMGLVLSVLLIVYMLSACSTFDKDVAGTQENSGAQKKHKHQHENPFIPSHTYEKGDIDASVPGVPVLMYHHILKASENKKFRKNPAVITPEAFAVQMKILHDNGYKTIQLDTLEQYVDKKIKLPAKTVVLTFDDGYLTNFMYAYPILKRYQYKATMFVITGSMQQDPEKFNPDMLNRVSWSELPKYSDVFTYEPHAHHFHRVLGKESFMLAQPRVAVKNDIHTVSELLHAHHFGNRYFAYPYGQYNQNTIKILKQEGIHMAFTTRKGRVYPGSPKFELNRIGVFPYTSLKEFKKSIGLNAL